MSQELTVTIPEDITLELDDGTLTLKSGSRIYTPNGIGIFDIYTLTMDKTISGPLGNGLNFIEIDENTKNLSARLVSNSVSGAGATAAGGLAYDTTTNRVKFYNANGSFSKYTSFPIAIVNVESGAITEIIQVFNGFGYIGNELFVTKNFSANIPSGFDGDGNPLFVIYTSDRVLIGEKTTNYPYLIGNDGHFTGIYCASSYNNYQSSSNLFFEGMKILARPLNVDTIEVNPSLSYTTKLIGQYANSPTMLKLANEIGSLFDDSTFIKNWYDVVFNLSTATGYGLDIWGKILNRDRKFTYDGNEYYLQGAQTIDGVDFTAEEMDNLYRQILQLTAMRYIGNASVASLNRMIQFIFDGKCYCIEYASMHIRYVFRFYMNKIQKAIIETLNPHPTGVLSSFEYLPVGEYFGFNVNDKQQDEQPYLPFDNGPFYD